jgi:hypothetical protein
MRAWLSTELMFKKFARMAQHVQGRAFVGLNFSLATIRRAHEIFSRCLETNLASANRALTRATQKSDVEEMAELPAYLRCVMAKLAM